MKKSFKVYRQINRNYEIVTCKSGSIYVWHDGGFKYVELRIDKGRFYLFGVLPIGYIRITKKQYRRFFLFTKQNFDIYVTYTTKVKIVYEKDTL